MSRAQAVSPPACGWGQPGKCDSVMALGGPGTEALSSGRGCGWVSVPTSHQRGVRQLWKPPAWSSADHRSHGEPSDRLAPAGGSACSSPGRPPAGAPVPHRDGRRRERLFLTGTAAVGAGTGPAEGGRRLRPRAGPGRRSTHPASPASRQAERPPRLPRKIRPLRKIRATGVARILPGSRILRENGTGEAERTKPSPAARRDAHGPGLTAHRSREYGPGGTTRRVSPRAGSVRRSAAEACVARRDGRVPGWATPRGCRSWAAPLEWGAAPSYGRTSDRIRGSDHETPR